MSGYQSITPHEVAEEIIDEGQRAGAQAGANADARNTGETRTVELRGSTAILAEGVGIIVDGGSVKDERSFWISSTFVLLVTALQIKIVLYLWQAGLGAKEPDSGIDLSQAEETLAGISDELIAFNSIFVGILFLEMWNELTYLDAVVKVCQMTVTTHPMRACLIGCIGLVDLFFIPMLVYMATRNILLLSESVVDVAFNSLAAVFVKDLDMLLLRTVPDARTTIEVSIQKGFSDGFQALATLGAFHCVLNLTTHAITGPSSLCLEPFGFARPRPEGVSQWGVHITGLEIDFVLLCGPIVVLEVALVLALVVECFASMRAPRAGARGRQRH
eukprot:4190946-Amphidinium_carterae.1